MINTTVEPLQDSMLDAVLWVDFIFSGVLTSVLAVLGFAGNVWSVYIIQKKFKLRRTMGLYLKVLALWDASLLFVAFFYYSLYRSLSQYFPVGGIFTVPTVILHPLASMTHTGTGWMMMVITRERYSAISRPITFRAQDTIKRARYICISVLVLSVLYCAPTALEFTIECDWENVTRIEHICAEITYLRNNNYYKLIYLIGLSLLTKSLGPFLIILFLSVKIITVVMRSTSDWEQRMTRRSSTINMEGFKRRARTDLTMAKMLLCLTFKFLLTQSLPTALNISETIISEAERTSGTFLIAVLISNFIITLNSATNWIVYLHAHRHTKKQDVGTTIQSEAALTRFRLSIPTGMNRVFRPRGTTAISINSDDVVSLKVPQISSRKRRLSEPQVHGFGKMSNSIIPFTAKERQTLYDTWDNIKAEFSNEILFALLLNDAQFRKILNIKSRVKSLPICKKKELETMKSVPTYFENIITTSTVSRYILNCEIDSERESKKLEIERKKTNPPCLENHVESIPKCDFPTAQSSRFESVNEFLDNFTRSPDKPDNLINKVVHSKSIPNSAEKSIEPGKRKTSPTPTNSQFQEPTVIKSIPNFEGLTPKAPRSIPNCVNRSMLHSDRQFQLKTTEIRGFFNTFLSTIVENHSMEEASEQIEEIARIHAKANVRIGLNQWDSVENNLIFALGRMDLDPKIFALWRDFVLFIIAEFKQAFILETIRNA